MIMTEKGTAPMLWDSPFTDGMKFIPVCSDV